MKIKVESRDFKKTIKLPEKSTVKDLMQKLKLRTEDYVISKNKKIVLPDEKLKDGDEIKLYSVISGG